MDFKGGKLVSTKKIVIRDAKSLGIQEQICIWNGWDEEILSQFKYSIDNFDTVEYDYDLSKARTKEHGLLVFKWMALEKFLESGLEENESACDDTKAEAYREVLSYMNELADIKIKN